MYNNFIERLTIQSEILFSPRQNKFFVRLKILIYLYELFKIIFTMLHKSIDL